MKYPSDGCWGGERGGGGKRGKRGGIKKRHRKGYFVSCYEDFDNHEISLK